MFRVLTSRRMLRIPPRKPKKEESIGGKEFLLLGRAIVVGFPVATCVSAILINIFFGSVD